MTFARGVQVFQVIRQGSWLLMMLALARASVPLAEVGQFEALRYLGVLLSAPLIGAAGTAYLRIRQRTADPDRWFVLMTLLTLLAGLAIIGTLDTAGSALARWLLDFADLDYTVPFGIFLLGSFIGALIEQEAIADAAERRLLGFAALSYGWQVVAFVVPLWYGLPIILVLWALATSILPRLGFLLWRYGRTRDSRLPPKPERGLFFSQTGQLTTYAFFGLAVLAIDYYLVGHYATDAEEAVAIWRYGSQEIPFMLGVLTALNLTALVEGGEGTAPMLSALKRRSRRANWGLMAFAAVAMVASPFAFRAVFGEAFHPAHVVFSTMLLALPSRLIATQPLMVSEDLQREFVAVGFGESLLNVAASLALLPVLGLLGVAIGTVIAYTFERLAYVYLLGRRGHALRDYAFPGELALMSAGLLVLYVTFTDFGALASISV